MPTDHPDRTSHGELLRRLEALKEQTERKRQELDALLAAVRRTVQDHRDARARRSPRPGASGSRAWQTLLEAKALAERSSEAKSQMLRTVAHDLRQPLQVIIAAAGQLEAHVPEARRHLLQRIDQSATRIERTLATLLEAARIEAASRPREAVPVRLAGLLRDIEEQFRPSAEAKGLAFRVVPAELRVLSDPSALASILQNLVGNAVKYTDKGRVLVGCRRRGPNGVAIEVHDTGRGIPKEELPLVFEAFRRVDPASPDGGVGLGLAIVRRQAEALGHRITVRSTPGKGSCFAVEVTLAPDDASGAAAPPDQG